MKDNITKVTRTLTFCGRLFGAMSVLGGVGIIIMGNQSMGPMALLVGIGLMFFGALQGAFLAAFAHLVLSVDSIKQAAEKK